MSNITKCVRGCAKELLCERWTMPMHPRTQAYEDFRPNSQTGLCGHYLANRVALAPDADDHLKNHNQD